MANRKYENKKSKLTALDAMSGVTGTQMVTQAEVSKAEIEELKEELDFKNECIEVEREEHVEDVCRIFYEFSKGKSLDEVMENHAWGAVKDKYMAYSSMFKVREFLASLPAIEDMVANDEYLMDKYGLEDLGMNSYDVYLYLLDYVQKLGKAHGEDVVANRKDICE